MTIKIQKGKIQIFRVFDVGEEINLEKAEAILEQNVSRSKFTLKNVNQHAVVVSSEPLLVSLGTNELHFLNETTRFELSAKVWEFGTISLCYEWSIPSGLDLLSLKDYALKFHEGEEMDRHARNKAKELAGQISGAMGRISEWTVNEDYLIYFIEKFSEDIPEASKLLDNDDIASLILFENNSVLSQSIVQKIYESKLQYYKNDLAVIDWNSAFIVEPSGSGDISDVIEFALNQLLEMRYYDDLLDKKLREIYSAIELKDMNIFSSRYTDLALDAGQKYIEIAEIVESVENSLKVIGDLYHSQVFRTTSSKFRFNDWQISIDNKLENLAEICKILLDHINSRRSHLLEIIVVLLISIELIPFFKETLTFFK